MLSTVSTYANQALSANALNTAKAEQTDKSAFGEYITQAVSAKQTPAIPDKWDEEEDWLNTVDKAVDYMINELGMDFSRRTPTHELTEEQKQWLMSRHDLNDIYKTVDEITETGSGYHKGWYDGNFLSDLIYLNVLSPEDVKRVGTVAFPAHEGGVLIPLNNWRKGFDAETVSGIFRGIAGAIGEQKFLIDYIAGKSNLSSDDYAYLNAAEKTNKANEAFYDILMSLFQWAEENE